MDNTRTIPNGIINASHRIPPLAILLRSGIDVKPLAVTVIFVVCELLAVGSIADGEKLQEICAAPLQLNETVPPNPAVALTVAVSDPLAPCDIVNEDRLSEPP